MSLTLLIDLDDTLFDEDFYPRLGLAYKTPQAAIAAFYAEEYPKLHTHTQPRPEAIALVHEALRRGWRVVVATNPLFPATATHQRLGWAGLPPITTFENAHFAKPNLAYFAEILIELGASEDPVIMVGNDLELDILPAHQYGLPAYWVRPETVASPETALPAPPPALGQGPLEGLIPWIAALPAASLAPASPSPAAMLALLRATTAAFSARSVRIPPAAWSQKTTLHAFTLTELVCHMRDVESYVNLPRVQKILAEPNPFLPGADTDAWADTFAYARQEGSAALQAFIGTRLETLALLTPLPPGAWQRTARHAIFGPTTLLELISFMVGHDKLHLEEIGQALNGAPASS